MSKRPGSPTAEPVAKRTTTRANAGRPPNRLGVLNTSSGEPITCTRPRSNPEEGGHPMERSVSQSISGRSSRSHVSTRSNRSVSSTVRQLEIDVLTEEEIDKLQQQYEVHERATELLEFSIKEMLDNIQVLKYQLERPQGQGEEQTTESLKQTIIELEAALKQKQQEAEKHRIDLKFEFKSLQRKQNQMRREAELQKQLFVEQDKENEDALSQLLSDDDSFDEEINKELEQLIRVDTVGEFQQQPATTSRAIPQRQRRVPVSFQTTIEGPLAATVPGISSNNLDDDELLIRLRKLQQPGNGGAHHSKAFVSETNHSCQANKPVDNLDSDFLSNQFAQVLSKAFDKLGSGSSNTEKFLARQVQGKDLPVFTGKPEEWAIFITAFENSTQGCGYSNMDNLPRLLKSIKGEALKTIQCLLSRPENVPIIINKLRMRFGRPEHIVQILIDRAKEVPAFKEDRLDLLIDFGLAVDNLVETIKSLNSHAHLTSPQLLEEFSKKLPVGMRTKWIEWVTSSGRKESLEEFAVWMSIQTEIACRLCPPKAKEESHSKKPWDEKRHRKREDKVWAVSDDAAAVRVAQSEKRNFNCKFCDGKGHQVFQCRQFEKQEVDEKWKFVKSNRLCFCCLKFGHSSKECRNKKECGKQRCNKTHHIMLHYDSAPPQKPDQPKQTPTEYPSKDHTASSTIGHAYGSSTNDNQDNGQINLMILPVQLKGPKGEMKTFAMLDPGATATVINSETAEKLGLEGESKPFIHSGLHPRMVETDSRSVTLEIFNGNGDKQFTLTNVRTKQQLDLPRQSVRRNLLKNWKHLKNLPIQCYDQGKPTILIGLDNLRLSSTLEIRLGPGNAPAAGRTELGWVLLGNVNEISQSEFCGMIHEKTDDELHHLVKQYFTTESFGVKVTNLKPRSKEDIVAQDIMDRTIRRVGKHWESGLLWKSEDATLPDNKQLAMSRLLQMERRMDRDPAFADKYIQKINEYILKGFARVLSIDELTTGNNRTFYLPHFMAKNPKKPKKLRFVFDAAAKVNGVSLNDVLLKGPDKLTSLAAMLLKFRQRRIGITADIKDMFHRVKVRKEDVSAQRFLWRGLDRDREPDVLEMGVLIFGAACSPTCAQEVKNLNAMEFQSLYPEGTKAIINNHYVDDYLDSVDTTEKAKQMFKEVREIHLHGGFNICNWISNSKELLSSIPEDLHAPGVKNMDFNGEAERVLGLYWKTEMDHFTFSKTYLKLSDEILHQERLPTKRELLALVMSIFDPLGFLANFTIKAKILLQDVWRSGIGWDDGIPKTLYEKWERWNEELHQIDTFQVPRCYSFNFSTATEIQLHVLCDASEQAYGAVTYFRIKKGDIVHVSFVMSKSKVAPTKQLTVPRLELQAALVGTRLAQFIQTEHDFKISKTVFWSDSTTVLQWIRADGKRFKQFVACRIGEILEASDSNQWNWIPTKINVADELTRDGQPSDWKINSRWINGPSFLKDEEINWPQEPVRQQVTEEGEEVKNNFMVSVITHTPVLDLTRFSNCRRAVRSIAYMFRFLTNCRFPSKRTRNIELVPEEIYVAERELWKLSQTESFAEEIYCLQRKKPLPNNSKILNLNVGLDEYGVMRVHGRLENAEIPQFTKRPVVLDKKQRFTQLLLSQYHVKGGHHGQEKVVNEVRQQFHILNVRAAVRKSWNDCQLCKNARAQPIIPLMGQLPETRLESFVSAFKNTGLDYFGPMSVTVGRRHEKRWGALFTCLSTRAIHVELVSYLNTDSCVMAIRRFVARRGSPVNIYSDNGTSFVGANTELQKALLSLDQQHLTAECTTRGITWHFIPPHAPHMGGSWERLVKSVKVAFHSILKERHPKEEVLQTIIVEAEMIVNSHPLTHVPVDPDDLQALTPNHFLIGRSSADQIPGVFDDTDLCLRKQWRQTQQLSNHFWKRWVKEYLPTLLRRTKWFKQTETIQVGDVVLVVDNQLSRNSWPMGIVVQLYPGKDGLVRVVDVRSAWKVFRRPVSKLCKLDVLKMNSEEKAEINSNIHIEEGSSNSV